MSSVAFEPSAPGPFDVLYWPAGVNSRLPLGANVSRRKNDVNVSLAYMLVFLIPRPRPPDRLGDAEGMTAGSGIVDGLGETDLLGAACDPNDDLLLCEVGGGFIGRASD